MVLRCCARKGAASTGRGGLASAGAAFRHRLGLSRGRGTRSIATASTDGSAGQLLLELLQSRELLNQCTDVTGLVQLVDRATTERQVNTGRSSTPPPRVYAGFDPTAPSLHVGHLVGLRVLRHFQAHGVEVVAVVGGVTAQIGDPSGRTTDRQVLDPEDVSANAEALAAALRRLLVPEGEPKTASLLVVNNSEWLGNMTVPQLLGGPGRHLRMGSMLAKDNVRIRLSSTSDERGTGTGMSFAEFAYPLLQAVDWVELVTRHNCLLQVGGSDQWGNIVDGVELVRRMHAHSSEPMMQQGSQKSLINSRPGAVGLTTPLLTDATGKKLGKSSGNAVWLEPEQTSPYELYQYLRRFDACTAGQLLRQLTTVQLPDIAAVVAKQVDDPSSGAAAALLAAEVVKWVHGSQGLTAAEKATTALYGASSSARIPSCSNRPSTDAELGQAMEAAGAPVVQLDMARFLAAKKKTEMHTDCVALSVPDLVLAAGLVQSKGEARRLLKAGGLYCNDNRVTGETVVVKDWVAAENGDSMEAKATLLFRAGKKRHALVVLLRRAEIEDYKRD